MNNQQQWFAGAVLICMFGSSIVRAETADDAGKCAAKLAEIDVAIEEARKEGSMRKVATLKDLRVEALRCANKTKSE